MSRGSWVGTMVSLVLAIWLGSAGGASAQSVAEALDTPTRDWQVFSPPDMTVQPTADPGVALDGVDALTFESAVSGSEARLTTSIVGPALVRWRTGGSLQARIGSGAYSDQTNAVVLIAGSHVLSLSVRGSGVLDQVEILDSENALSLSDALDRPGVTWSDSSPGLWRVLGTRETPPKRAVLSQRLSSSSALNNSKVSLRASFSGSRALRLRHSGAGSFSMVQEHPHSRPLTGWAVPGEGPHTVRLDFTRSQEISSYVIIESAEFVESEPIGDLLGLPGVVWTTGSERPWMVRAGTEGPELVSATVRGGESSWLEAAMAGPGVLTFRSDQWDLNQHPSTIWRIDGVAAPLLSTAGRTNVAHIPAGAHVVRWESSAPEQSRALDTVITLKGIQWTPSAAPGFADILAAEGTTARPWVSALCEGGTDWSVAADGPRLALTKASLCTEGLRWLVPGPGTVSARWRTTGTPPDSASLTGPKLASYGTAPTGFYDWTEVTGAIGARWPAALGQPPVLQEPVWSGQSTGQAAVWLDDMSWSPAVSLPLEEAVDHTGRLWTTGGNAAGLIRGLASPVVLGATGNDAVVISGLRDDDTAWMEMTVAGPAAFLANVACSHRNVRLLVDGVPVGHIVSPDFAHTSRAAFLAPSLNIPLSAGSHTLRFEARGRPAWRASDVCLIDKVSVIGATVAPAAEMVDTPDRAWAAHGFTLAALAGAQAHDGTDALSLAGSGDTMLATRVTGPALLSWWWRPLAGVGPGAGFRLTLDGRNTIPLDPSGTTWTTQVMPIPEGEHELAFCGSGSGQRFALDQFEITPTTTLPLAEALDLAAGSFVGQQASAMMSVALPTLAADGSDAVVLFDRWLEGGIRWQPPGPGRLLVKARSLNNLGSFIRLDDADRNVSFLRFETFQTTVTASLEPITITVSEAPLVLDQFTFIPDGPGGAQAARYYEIWLISQGLTAEQAPPQGDLDGDGLSNAVEHAFGLLATTPDAGTISTDTSRGLPRVTTVLDPASGQLHLEVSLVGPVPGTMPQMTYRVEESSGEEASSQGVWRLSQTPMSSKSISNQLALFRWRSADPVTPGRHQFVRVRAALE